MPVEGGIVIALSRLNRVRSVDIANRRVTVEPDERRLRERGGHLQGRGAVAAADVGHPGARRQGADRAVECGEPLGDEVVQVPGAEEPLAALVHVVVVVAPRHAVARAEGVGDAVGGLH